MVRWYFALHGSVVVRCGIYNGEEDHAYQKGVRSHCPIKHALGPVDVLSRGHHGLSEARGTFGVPAIVIECSPSLSACLVVLMFFESKVLSKFMAAMIVLDICVRRSSGWLPSVLRQLFFNRLFASM